MPRLGRPSSRRRPPQAPDPRKAVPMSRREQARRSGRGWRAAAIGVAVAAVTAAMIGPVGSALAAPRDNPASPAAMSGGTPSGWAPVTYRGAQLSVPKPWIVESPHQFLCGPPRSRHDLRGRAAWVAPQAGIRRDRQPGLDPAGREDPAGDQPSQAHRRDPRHPGLPAERRPGHRGYLVPQLGVQVGARGQQARRVLATLNRSPLEVVLGRDTAARCPPAGPGGCSAASGSRPRAPGACSARTSGPPAAPASSPRSLLLIDATKPPLPCRARSRFRPPPPNRPSRA